MSQYHTPGFRNTVSEFLDDLSLHSIVCDLTTQSSSGTARLDNSRRHLQHFIHPSISSIVLDLSVIPLPHVPDMWLFVARRRHVHNHIIGSA